MRAALLISHTVLDGVELATAWAAEGHDVTVVLLDGAAAAARPGHAASGMVERALEAGIALAAHDDALRRRALSRSGLVDGVKVVDLEAIADLVAEGADRAVWL